MQNTMRDKIRHIRSGFVLSALALCIVLYGLVSVLRIITTSAPDFSVYYRSAENLASGRNIYEDSALYTGLGYPPSSLLPYLPLIILPYGIAQGIWVTGSFACVFLAVFLMLRLLGKDKPIRSLDYPAWISLALLFFPTKFTLGMGQVNLIVLVLVLLSVSLAGNAREGLAGVCYGLAVLLKPHLVLIAPAYLLTGFGKTVFYALILNGSAMAITGWFFGWELFSDYFHVVVPPLAVFKGRELYYNQGVQAFLSRTVPVMTAAKMSAILSVSVYAGGAVVVHRIRKNAGSGREAVAVFLALLLFIEPLAWQHHYVFILPLLMFSWYAFGRKKIIAGMIILSYLLMGTNIRDPGNVRPSPFSPILVSHVFIGSVILLGTYLYGTIRTGWRKKLP